MTWSPILAFAIIALAFGIGDVIAAKTRGVISSVLVAILLFLIFGSTLKVLPADLMEQSGLMSLIPTFGMALILVNVGSMLDLNDLKREWKTVIISLAGVAGLVTIYLTAGTLIFGKECRPYVFRRTGHTVAEILHQEAQNKGYLYGVNRHFKPEIHGRRLLIYAMKAVCVSSALARLTGRTVPSVKVTLVRLQI